MRKEDKEDLKKTVKELRREIRELRETVNMLLTMVIDIEEDEENELPFPQKFRGDQFHNS